MPVPWFDLTKNSAGVLTTRLSTDCLAVNGMVTTTISITFQNISTLICGLVIAFVY